MKRCLIDPHNVVSEKHMCELFGLATRQLRELAIREGFHVAKVSNKTRLYDLSDVSRIFAKYEES